jgi:transposase
MARHVDISPERLQEAVEALKRLPDSKLQLRLLAVVKAAEKGISCVSDFFEVHYNTVSVWVRRFNAGGVAALQDKPKGHNPSKLSAAQRHEIERWIETQSTPHGEVVHWTLEKLRAEIQQAWGISIAVGPLWGHLQRLGYRHKSVRPRHTNRPDEATVEAFKKTPHQWSRTS